MNHYDISDYLETVKNKTKNHSYIQINDYNSVRIEICKKITVFNENCLIIELAKCSLEITGLNLSVRNYSKEGIVVNGIIHSLKFEPF